MTSTRYPSLTNQQIDESEYRVHGIFVPGSDARARRTANAALGLNTCGHLFCQKAFRPQRIVLPGGALYRPGRGRWYCSRACMLAERAHRAQLYRDLEDEYPDVRDAMLATDPWYFA